MRPELDHWPDEEETARRFGITSRGLRKWVAAGKAPERRLRPRIGGGKPVACYNPEQIENMLDERRAKGDQVLAPDDPRLPREPRGIPAEMGLSPLAAAIQQLSLAVLSRIPAPQLPQAPPKPFGTPETIGAELGLSGGLIRRGIAAGIVPAVRDRRGFIVSRAHLEHPELFQKLAALRGELRQAVENRRAARG